MIRITPEAIYIEDEIIELTSELSQQYGLAITGCHMKFCSTKEMLEDLADHPENKIDTPVDFDPPVKRIGVYNGDFYIEGQVIQVYGTISEQPRMIAKRCRVITNGFKLDPDLLMGTYDLE